MCYVSLERPVLSASACLCCIKINDKSYKMMDTKIKDPSLEIYRKDIPLMEIIILLSSYVVYFFCMSHLESFFVMHDGV